MKVKLLDITQNCEELIELGARVCYASLPKEESRSQFIQNLIKRGHEGPLEHAKATFEISGVSRALTHQLVRHRIASFNQRSQRYVKEVKAGYIVPESIMGKGFGKDFTNLLDKISDLYEKMLEAGVNAEDARYILPNACETSIIMTMNFREFRHFLKLRLDKSAQWEIRTLAQNILEILKQYSPIVFYDF